MSGLAPVFSVVSDRLEKRLTDFVKGMDPDEIPDESWYTILALVDATRDYMAVSKACIDHLSKERV